MGPASITPLSDEKILVGLICFMTCFGKALDYVSLVVGDVDSNKDFADFKEKTIYVYCKFCVLNKCFCVVCINCDVACV